MDKISIDDFSKIELKVGTVLSAEEVEGSEKLLKLQVDLGPLTVIPEQAGIQESHGSRVKPGMTNNADGMTKQEGEQDNKEQRDIRQILSGVKQWYEPEDFVGKQVIVIANLEPRKMMGLESQGMLLAASGEQQPVFLMPSKEVPAGAKIR